MEARVIAASSRNLDDLVEAGLFRKDLFYRLSVHHIVIPPLRERPEDIPLLAEALLHRLAAEYGMSAPPRVAPETFEILQAHEWPGNVRELRNVLSRALSLGAGSVIRPENLLLRHKDEPRAAGDAAAHPDVPLEQIERVAIKQTLHRHGNDMLESAKALGISCSALLEKVKRYGLS